MLSRELYFIPSRVDLKDIREEKDGVLFLLDQEDRNTLISLLSDPAIPDGHYSKHKQLKTMLSHADKKLKENNYDVIKLNGELYLVYKGVQETKHVGSGGEAVVKATQNLRTGSWEGALKIYSERHVPEKGEQPIVTSSEFLANREQEIKNEYENLKQAGLAIGLLPRRTNISRKGIQDAVLMRFVHGEDIIDFSNRYIDPNATKLPVTEWLNIIIQMCEIVQQLHAENKIHRDLKLENFRYDAATKKVTLIDFSSSRTLDENREFYEQQMIGTAGYIPKETLAEHIFTPKSDNFALGATIAAMLGMTNEEAFVASGSRAPYILKSENSAVNADNPFVSKQHLTVLGIIYDICNELMADNDERPGDLLDIINDLKDIKNQIKETLAVGIIDVAKFRHAEPADKQEMLEYFKQFNEVIFIDTDTNGSLKDHVILQRELAKDNVIVRDKVLIGEERQAINAIQSQYSNEEPSVIRKFYDYAGEIVSHNAEETKSATLKLLSIQADLTQYKGDKLLGNANKLAEMEDNLQKLEGFLVDLMQIRQTLKGHSDVANKKYLELCASYIDYTSKEIVALTQQLTVPNLHVATPDKKEPVENLLDDLDDLVSLNELDDLAMELQGEKVSKTKHVKIENQRKEALELLANQPEITKDMQAQDQENLLNNYKEIVAKLEQIPINKRLPDDVMLLADLASHAVKMAENFNREDLVQ